jgi:hypothetical protein
MKKLQTKKYIGALGLLGMVSMVGIYANAQTTTNTNLNIGAGVQSIYAGDSIDNNDICSATDIVGGVTVEGVVCSTAANSINLGAINIQGVRQNPQTILNDVLVEDLRGVATSNYTVTAAVSNFTTGSANINLGTNPDSAPATLDTGTVTSVAVTAGGSGYTTASVLFSGGGATTQATAEAVISSGVITKINITSPGSGYTSAPTVAISGAGTGATATAYIIAAGSNESAGTVNSITVAGNGGSACTTVPVVISGGGGTGATGSATIAGGVVSSIVVTNPGSGYTSAPTVAFTGHDCASTPTATASITADGAAEANIFATMDPSVGDIDRILPDSNVTSFNVGPRSLATNTTTQYTLFSTSAAVPAGRFDIDATVFGLRVPAFVQAGTYTGTIVQTVIN